MPSFKKIERQLQGVLGQILSRRIRERGLENQLQSHVPTEDERADLPILDSKGNTILFIELKDPRAADGHTIYNHEVMGREMKRARKMGVQFFGICNFIEANLIDVEYKNRDDVIEDGLLTHADLDRLRIKWHFPVIEAKLTRIADWYIDHALGILQNKVRPRRTIDELFIHRIKSLIRGYNTDVSREAWDQFEHKKSFRKDLQSYAKKQQWSSTIITSQDEIESFTYLSLLLLVSKLVFYKALCDFGGWNLPKLVIPQNITSSEKLERLLWGDYFEQAVTATGDFRLLIGDRKEFIQQLPFISDASVDLVKSLVDAEALYDFSQIPYDVVGRIFEELIRDDDRHKRGQYFTPARVVDLINAFCIRTGNESVLDPSCGSGTFLVRAYDRKQKLANKIHPDLVEEIYGVDISPYAAHLSMLNIAMRDLRHQAYPNIECRDFFSEPASKPLPSTFDAVIGNPPYTRQEETDDYLEGSKRRILGVVSKEWKISPSAKTSLYGYFFYGAAAKLRDGGRFGFLTSNSWMDTDFGEDLQKWMLANFEIEAIIDTKCERFFPSAAVNTNITVLRRQSDAAKRASNIVRFVYLKVKLSELYAQFSSADAIRDFIESKKKDFEDATMRIRVMEQSKLATIKKWTPILKAPQIFFDILKKGEEHWQPLSEGIAEVRFGIKTGKNDFFQLRDRTNTLTDGMLRSIRNNAEHFRSKEEIERAGLRAVETGTNEMWLIEEQYLRSVIKSSKEIKAYKVDPKKLSRKLLMVKEGPSTIREQAPYLYKYIKDGEKKGYDEVESVKSRPYWYNLGSWEPADALWFASYHDRFFVPRSNGTLEDKRLYGITFKNKKDSDYVLGVLNSSIFPLIYEIGSRSNLGEGATEWAVYEVKTYPIPFKSVSSEQKKRVVAAFKQISKGEIQSIFEELHASQADDVLLSKVSAERKELDLAVLEAIGFDSKRGRETVLLEIYQSVIDLIRSRIDKSQSVEQIRNGKKTVTASLYLAELKERIKDAGIIIERTPGFLKKLSSIVREITEDKKLHTSILRTYWKREFDETVDKKKLELALQTNLFE